jgi:hypothetical protein
VRKAAFGLVLAAFLAHPPFALADANDAGPFVDKATGLVFPPELGAYKRGPITSYPDPKLGVKVEYIGPGKADVFVYDMGLQEIPTGVDSQAVEEAFQQSLRGMTRLVSSPPASDGKKIIESTPEVKTDGKVAKLRLAVFTWQLATRDGPRLMSTHVIVTGFKNHFVKLLYTHPGEWQKETQTDLKALIVAFLEANPGERGAFLLEAKP